jgi:hypothetical protein
LGLRKPPRDGAARKVKPKASLGTINQILLNQAAESAVYFASPYHCRESGLRPARRSRPGTPCRRNWRRSEAENALKRSIRAGRVSEVWNGDFPRWVWYRDDDGALYEARSELKTPERYHAYPVERHQIPRDIQW